MGWDQLIGGIGDVLGGPLGGAIGSTIGGLFSNNSNADAAQAANQARQSAIANQLGYQQQALAGALGTQQNQFGSNLGLQQRFLTQGQALGNGQLGSLTGLFNPYTMAGAGALPGMAQFGQGGLNAFGQQQALSGALGGDAQAAARSSVLSDPAFTQLAKQGEDAILQNASATGGLHGGNVQAALAQFRPALADQFIQRQIGNLGTISGLGSQNLGALGQLGYGAASTFGGLSGDVLRGQLGLIGQAGGNLTNSSNVLANNMANLTTGFGSGISSLLGQAGQFNAGNAMLQGQYAGANMNDLGSLGGRFLQQYFSNNRNSVPGYGGFDTGGN